MEAGFQNETKGSWPLDHGQMSEVPSQSSQRSGAFEILEQRDITYDSTTVALHVISRRVLFYSQYFPISWQGIFVVVRWLSLQISAHHELGVQGAWSSQVQSFD